MEVVLNGYDGGDRMSLGEVGDVHIAEAKVADQALLAQPGEHLKAFGKGLPVRRSHHANTQVDHVEAIQA